MSAAPAVSSRLVSVIVPTRDRAALLDAALRSLSEQSYADLEVIVVDDASRDDTPRVIHAAAERDPRIRSLRHERPSGAAAARNSGAGLARGEFLLFEDDDCRGEPGRVADLVSALERDPGAAYAYCWMRVEEKGRAPAIKEATDPWAIATPCALVRASSFHDVGGFDANLPRLQDFDLWVRLYPEARAVEVPRALVTMLRDGSGISSSPERLRAACRHMMEKYRGSDYAPEHLARMHRYLAGALLVHGMRRDGLAHFRRSLRLRPWSGRTWLGLVLATLGPAVYRGATDLRRLGARGAVRRELVG